MLIRRRLQWLRTKKHERKDDSNDYKDEKKQAKQIHLGKGIVKKKNCFLTVVLLVGVVVFEAVVAAVATTRGLLKLLIAITLYSTLLRTIKGNYNIY